MKKIWLILVVAGLALAGCHHPEASDAKVMDAVDKQQGIYAENQPIPIFDWSRQLDLWQQFYKAQNKAAATHTFITTMTGELHFETPSQGYPIPFDTQLTNPMQIASRNVGSNWYDGVIPQAEPNGLFTPGNSDATIVMAVNSDGTLSPVYTELKATAYPFPVRWDEKLRRVVRVEGKESSIKLTPKEGK